MSKKIIDNVKLGIFVMAGLLLLIFSLYMIGRTESLFGSTFKLRTHFKNTNGLTKGNNIRYSGIQVGTVKSMQILNDTTIEVVMVIEEKARTYIHTNAITSIGNEGLMGNKVINISPGKGFAPVVNENDIILSQKSIDTDEMLQTLNKTNENIAVISEELKSTVLRINNSSAIWKILNDNSLASNLKIALENIRLASVKSKEVTTDLYTVINDVKKGKGSAGILLRDTAFAVQLNEAVVKLKQAGDNANRLAEVLTNDINKINNQIEKGQGVITALINDTSITLQLKRTLDNIEKGTDGFNANMEALKHNIFFRGYFRKLEKQKKKI
ncbi:MAG: MCE family protein [Sphingobacteriales bacterium]|nr:MCE family protein [Sphingobacteriales bacterium]